MREFPMEIRNFAREFVELQIARQQADYALDTEAYQKYDTLGYIVSVEAAIVGFKGGDVGAKRNFAAHALFRQRLL